MSNKQETIADIVAAMRNEGHAGDASCLEWVGAKIRGYADRIEEAHRREVDSLNFKLMTAKSEQKTAANVIIEQTNKVEKLDREVAELCGERNGILNANASLAADNDRLRREVAELEREVAELRECLKEAIREKCPFTRMSCKHGEPCDYECGTVKWRKVLKGASND